MDNKHDILQLLRSVAEGATAPENALLKLKEAPFPNSAENCLLKAEREISQADASSFTVLQLL